MFKNNNVNLKKEFERMGSTVTGLVESEIYAEYKEYSKSVYSVLKDNGFIKEKK